MEFNKFESGAVRDEAELLRYDLIPQEVLDALAEVFTEGAKKYGDRNWEKGLPISSTFNHLMRHLGKWVSGDTSEPHLKHALCNLAFLVTYVERRMFKIIDIPAVKTSMSKRKKE
jgi:hypothetical protein